MADQIDMWPMVGADLVVVSPPPKSEAVKRDHVLDNFEETRGDLLTAGRRMAGILADGHGSVTSVMVLERLRLEGWGPQLDAVDPRWAGGIFRGGTGWKRAGYRPDGSHCRPVAVWERA